MNNTKSRIWFIALALVCLLHLAAPTKASADVIVIVTGTFSDGTYFLPWSTITINPVTGIADAANILLSNGVEFIGPPSVIDTDTEYDWESTDPSGIYELRMIPLTTFDTIIGGSGNASTAVPNVGLYPTGNFTAIATSANSKFSLPEPATVILSAPASWL